MRTAILILHLYVDAESASATARWRHPVVEAFGAIDAARDHLRHREKPLGAAEADAVKCCGGVALRARQSRGRRSRATTCRRRAAVRPGPTCLGAAGQGAGGGGSRCVWRRTATDWSVPKIRSDVAGVAAKSVAGRAAAVSGGGRRDPSRSARSCLYRIVRFFPHPRPRSARLRRRRHLAIAAAAANFAAGNLRRSRARRRRRTACPCRSGRCTGRRASAPAPRWPPVRRRALLRALVRTARMKSPDGRAGALHDDA